LIHVEDGRDNSYDTMPVKELLFRAKALNDMKIKFDGTESNAERAAIVEERKRIQKLVEDVLVIVEQAREQGQPDDPTADHARRKRRSSAVMPANTGDGKKKIVKPSPVDMQAIESMFS
jgi:hypothetical protein